VVEQHDGGAHRRRLAKLGNVTVSVLSRHDLIVNEKAFGRLQDLADVERLEALDIKRRPPK
jgi:hypothetical protein